MGSKTLWVDYTDDWVSHSITVPEDQPLFKVHRLQSGIHFESSKDAMKTLSPKAYMMFMYLILHAPSKEWRLSPQRVVKQTSLSANDITPTLEELTAHGYWVPGDIRHNGNIFSSNTFHVWENPSMNQSCYEYPSTKAFCSSSITHEKNFPEHKCS